jgi:hypothetical protein
MTLLSCLCSQTVVKTEKGNTSGMAGHLRTSHPDLFLALKTSRESNEAFDGIEAKEAADRKQEDGQPYSVHGDPSGNALTAASS